MAGTLLVIVGISYCAVAGRRREIERFDPTSVVRSGLLLGLVICALASIFSPMLNFSFVFGEELQRQTSIAGASVEARIID